MLARALAVLKKMPITKHSDKIGENWILSNIQKPLIGFVKSF